MKFNGANLGLGIFVIILILLNDYLSDIRYDLRLQNERLIEEKNLRLLDLIIDLIRGLSIAVIILIMLIIHL